jgi:restriction system protein
VVRRHRSSFELVIAAVVAIVTAVYREPALLIIPCLLGAVSGMAAISNNPAGGATLTVACLATAAALGRWRYRRWRREEAESAEAARVHAIRASEIANYHVMNPSEFEQALGYLCARDGCTDVRVVGRSGDLGADVTAITPTGARLVIQAKRYKRGNNVSGPDLQRFGGTCFTIHGAGIAAVVTTAGYTKQARTYAHLAGIRLFDNDALAGWASRTGPAPWM